MKLLAELFSGERCFEVGIELCNTAVTDFWDEVNSHLNWHGTQLEFGVHDTTIQQRLSHYCSSGGAERFMRRHQLPRVVITHTKW